MSPPVRDQWLKRILAGAALVAGLLLLPIILLLLWRSLPLLRPDSVWQALTSATWQPGSGEYGLLAMITGSLLVSLLALGLAAPVGILFAVGLNLYLPPAPARLFRGLQELLAGIPSVVYGLWGLMTLVPLVNRYAPPGASLIAAVLVLSLMILPYSALLCDAELQPALRRRRAAAEALALSRWSLFRHVLWPETRAGIMTGLVLQFGRALGETMAVLMVAGNVVQLPSSLFDPIRTLTANIALEMGYASGSHQTALFLSGLILMLVTLLIMGLIPRRQALS